MSATLKPAAKTTIQLENSLNTQISVDASASPAVAPAPAATPPAPPTAAAPTAPPSVHVRALITWVAIFPLVASGMMLLGPLMESWHPVLRSLLLTAVVVPTAVYFVVPKLFASYGKLTRRRTRTAPDRQ